MEISFDYDNESTENVQLSVHNYKNGKYIGSQDVTKTYSFDMLTAMVNSVDVDEERNNEIEAKFDDMFSNSKGEDVFTQINSFFK